MRIIRRFDLIPNQHLRKLNNLLLLALCFFLLFLLYQRSNFSGERYEVSNTNFILVKWLASSKQAEPDKSNFGNIAKPQAALAWMSEVGLNRKAASIVRENDKIQKNVDAFTNLHTFTDAWCPEEPSFLLGRVNMNALMMVETISEEDVQGNFTELRPGGEWAPTQCRARHRVALIVPFRDRQKHLNTWLMHIIPILKRQLLDFRIIVVEQNGTGLFNKGRLFNAGFLYAESLNVSCTIFHDVDLYPENDRNLYTCHEIPRHMGAYVNTLNYTFMYNHMVGGVLNLNMKQYRRINGYSNYYWGWGGEDDDIGLRILSANLPISRPAPLVGRYTMAQHKSRRPIEGNPRRWELIRKAFVRQPYDGLNKVMWKILQIDMKPLYHHILVDVGNPFNDVITLPIPTNSTVMYRTALDHAGTRV